MALKYILKIWLLDPQPQNICNYSDAIMMIRSFKNKVFQLHLDSRLSTFPFAKQISVKMNLYGTTFRGRLLQLIQSHPVNKDMC